MPPVVALALALLLLPGLLVVRAPWTVVPALSLAFWVVSAAWLPSRLSRSAFVAGALVCFASLALLRLLPKHEVEPPPGYRKPARLEPPPRPGLPPPRFASLPSALVLLASLLLLAVSLPFPHAPGEQLAFQTTAARLVLWRDGLPLSAEPLLPLTPFTAHAPALSLLAADAAAQAAIDPARAVVMVLAAAAALVPIGLFALHGSRLRPPAAAVAAVLSLSLVPWPGFVAAWGAGPALLALGFVLPACALLLGHASRSSGWASALLCAAGLLSQPLLVLAALAAVAVCRRRPPVARLAGVASGALALALPVLVRAAGAVSSREWLWAVTSVTRREWLELAVGAGLLVCVPRLLAYWLEGGARGEGRGLLLLGVVAVLLLVLRHGAWMGEARLTGAQRTLLERAQATGPLEVLCAPGDMAGWLPALAGRAAEPVGWVPSVYRDERSSRIPRSCRTLAPPAR